MGENKKAKISDAISDYSTEGMIVGGLAGVAFFVMFVIFGHASYGAICIAIGVCAGLLFGMSKKKPVKKSSVDREVEAYKKLDMQRNAFFPDASVKPYNPTKQRPVLRTRIANGERMAGFINLRNGEFEEAMLISSEEDLQEFMRRYKIGSRNEIQDGM